MFLHFSVKVSDGFFLNILKQTNRILIKNIPNLKIGVWEKA